MMEEMKMGNSIFLTKDISEIHNGFKDGQLDPLTLAENIIDLYDLYQNKFYPWVSFNKEILMKNALVSSKAIKNKDFFNLLEGIPFAVKDIINTYDFPTQMGSPLWKGFTPGNDARIVYNLKHRGAFVAGKTVTAEFAVHTLNETMNPHDITKTPGTSSSGSAVAIALGMVPVALGTQTAGSIIRPASFCGIYGCKPSFGLIPRTGMLKTTDTLDTVGFLTVHYKDIRRVFESIRVHGPNFPMSYNAFKDPERINKPKNRPWKIAICKTHTWSNAYDYAKKSLIDFVDKLAKLPDIEVTNLDLPGEFNRSHDIHAVIYNKTLSYYFAEEFKKSELVSPIMNDLIIQGNKISPAYLQNAINEQRDLIYQMDKIFTEYDIIISLSTAGEAPLRHKMEEPDPCLIWTMAHLPVISVPRFTSPSGLPFGLQLVARKYSDYLLFNFLDYLYENGFVPKSANKII